MYGGAMKKNSKGRKSSRKSKKASKSRKTRGSKKWVQSVTSQLSHPGALSRQAKAAGMSTKAFAHKVLRNPGSYSLTTRRRAQFFVNINRRN